MLDLVAKIPVHALAHITGGGLIENLPRVLPADTRAVIDPWSQPAIFNWLQSRGNIAGHEMLRTFNCGVGMVLCVAAEDATTALAALKQSGEYAWPIGAIETRRPDEAAVLIRS